MSLEHLLLLLHLSKVDKEDDLFGLEHDYNAMVSNWNEVCHFEELRSVLDSIGKLACEGIDAHHEVSFLGALTGDVEMAF